MKLGLQGNVILVVALVTILTVAALACGGASDESAAPAASAGSNADFPAYADPTCDRRADCST